MFQLLQEKVVAAAPKPGARKISMKEVELHADKESAWFVRDGKVSSLPFCCGNLIDASLM